VQFLDDLGIMQKLMDREKMFMVDE
jgi:hypothetical protein